MGSSFFVPGQRTSVGQLASLHLSRDQQLPVILSNTVSRIEDEGYAEGMVTNTRFGSFPHSTLIDVPWGSQVLASKVDTGSRGRRDATQGKKRKASAISTDSPADSSASASLKEATTATSGFVHVLPPTPENWTTSLPHRTQVVYTPDYSYILHRIRVRPGSVLIEAGSGSGSFTHAAARAVLGTHVRHRPHNKDKGATENASKGRVYTYEFHAERHEKVKEEMIQHRLDNMVTATHRDVYSDGFLLKQSDTGELYTPSANAVFLDLPAPWEALQHLTRTSQNDKPSALDPASTVHICTFSPCIEQAQKTISSLRRHGWVDIEMVELQHNRVDVRREYTGLQYDGMRGVNAMPIDVDEAVSKLREVEDRAQSVSLQKRDDNKKSKGIVEQNRQQDAKIFYKAGRIVHRSEPELKTHTSYLVFGILPREWSDDQEAKARQQVAEFKAQTAGISPAKSQRQVKKEMQRKGGLTNGTGELGTDSHDASRNAAGS